MSSLLNKDIALFLQNKVDVLSIYHAIADLVQHTKVEPIY